MNNLYLDFFLFKAYAITWLRFAFFRSVPVMLLSNCLFSGNAELAVAAHLGQLAMLNSNFYPSFGISSIQNQNNVGDWGPHLIITPRLCLPAWKMRLANWCPGFRIVCLGLGGELDGTGRSLRSSVSRGTMNICIATYAAVHARSSRFYRIQWSTVVFDQV